MVVIYGFEMIDIGQNDTTGRIRSKRTLPLTNEDVHHDLPVLHPGKRVQF